jgi:diguanylate cyclase (GGDEF)-like protein/PAS domain S-box-containing protein
MSKNPVPTEPSQNGLEAAQFSRVIEGAQVMLYRFCYQPEPRVEYLNAAVEAIIGYSAEDFYSNPGLAFEIIHPDDRDRLGEYMAQGALPDGPITLRWIHKDGSTRWLEYRNTLIYNDDGNSVGIEGIAIDVSERVQAKQDLEYIATHDPLTRLPNRVLLHDRLEQALRNAERSRKKVAVIFIDLDRFKAINDTLGHDRGDELLERVARRLQDGLRASDTVARLGGDEFVMILEGINSSQDVVVVIQKIYAAFAQPFPIDEHQFFINISLGISIFPNDARNTRDLLRSADTAMYTAKDRGRNNYQFYDSKMNARALERLLLENRMQSAISNGEFELLYQPQVELDTSRIIGVEALLRWDHPTLGMLRPAQFLSIAEESGMIEALGEWVIRTACSQNVAWEQDNLPSMRMAVNLSIRQLHRDGFAQKVADILADTGHDPNKLELEFTESLIHAGGDALSELQALKEVGVRISLDDFGTGYSSLVNLKRMPIDSLKIDESFVYDISTGEDGADIASAIIAMAHMLKLDVVAEGVETEKQFNFLRLQECNQVQGYYLYRPISGEAVAGLLERGGSRLTNE